MQSNNDPNNQQVPERTFNQYVAMAIHALIPWAVILGSVAVIIVVVHIGIQIRKGWIEEEQKESAAKKEVVSTNVTTWVIEKHEFIDNIQLPGVIEAQESLTVQSEVTGKIEKFNVDDGDEVKKGEILAVIEKSDYLARLDQAEAGLVLAEQKLRRSKRLKKQGAIPQSELDSVLASHRDAKATVQTAGNNLSRCSIRAPFGGIINKRHITLGTLVTPGSEIVDLLDNHKVKVNIGIPEADVVKVSRIESTEFTVDSLKGKKFRGKKTFLSIKPISQAKVYNLQLSVDNKDRLLRPGMFVEANIVKEKKKTIVIPLYTVITRGSEQFCYITENEKAVRKDVTLGIKKGKYVEITSGLNIGDELIVEGQRQIDNGSKVTVIEKIDNVLN
jgi:membrane fusion protein (multidrug efflux system)